MPSAGRSAVGLTTLGLAGLLVATHPVRPFGQRGVRPRVGSAAPVGGAGVEPGDGTDDRRPIGGAPAAASPLPAAPGPGQHRRPASPRRAAPAGASRGIAAGSDAGHRLPSSTTERLGRRRQAAPRPARVADGTQRSASIAQDDDGVPPLILLSVAFLLAGLRLFAMRWTARRFGDG